MRMLWLVEVWRPIMFLVCVVCGWGMLGCVCCGYVGVEVGCMVCLYVNEECLRVCDGHRGVGCVFRNYTFATQATQQTHNIFITFFKGRIKSV